MARSIGIRIRFSLLISTPVVPLLAVASGLAACSSGGGGGGGGGPSPAPPVTTPSPSPSPSPAPSPTPTPTPPATNFDTSEYRATGGAVSMNALAAYNAGGRGQGVKVGIIDSGIDLDSAEFGGRIDPASRSTAGSPSADDEDGHGTAVAFTAAGRRNGAGTHGVAFEATVIALRADTPGSCSTTSGDDDGCSFSTTAIASAIDVATQNGARVINISLGGGSATNTLNQAINRATQAGVIIVISSGNDGAAQPDPFTAPAINAAISRGLVIIAGSVGTSDQMSSFSNRAGSSANFYLSAVGEQVRAPDNNNTPFLWSGTSFSAPQISGAVALLASAFPNLTGAEIVALLYASARDAGAPGPDAVYGRGVMDLTRAFQPIGALSLAGSRAPASESANAALSAAMGDAATVSLGAIVLDGFDRAYALDLARTIQRSGPARRLDGALRARHRSLSVGVKDMAVAVTIVPGPGETRIDRMSIGRHDAERARAIAASVTGRLGAGTSFAIGASERGNALVARVGGAMRSGPAFLVAPESGGAGFVSDVHGAVALRHMVGSFGVTASAESGAAISRSYEAPLLARFGRERRLGFGQWALAVDRTLGPVTLQAGATLLAEADTVLGARFGGALGAARARSTFLDGGAQWDLGGGWQLGGTARLGWTNARLRGGVEGSGLLRTSAYAVDLVKRGVFDRWDHAGLRIAQPLRVATGGLDLLLPSSYTYDGEQVDGWSAQRLNLAPTGREVDVEFAYGRTLRFGDVSANLFYRRDPGNFAALPDDLGVAMRFTLGF